MIDAKTARKLTNEVLSSPNQEELDRLLQDAENSIKDAIHYGERDTSVRIRQPYTKSIIKHLENCGYSVRVSNSAFLHVEW